MSSKKKGASGFMNFTMQWKSKYGVHMTVAEAISECDKTWKKMTVEERAVYNAKKKNATSNENVRKLTCTGIPLSFVEQEKQELQKKTREMKRDVENTVSKGVKNDELATQSYYFIMANYFTKTFQEGVYVPAELSVSEYSLKDGIKRIYHTLINPGINIYGHLYEAQQHSEATHNLPLPPNALGEKCMGSIYNDILNFIRHKDTNYYPPIYTHRDVMPIVESVLDFLKADVESNNINLKIYPIQYLFFIMKEATCEVGELEKPKNIYITDAFFDRDFFEYSTGIACQYHEEIDKGKYCTQSYLTRWCYMFSDYMCADIAISLIAGRHCPKNTNVKAALTPAPSTCVENESVLSMDTASSYATKACGGSKIYYDDKKSTPATSDVDKEYNKNFPSFDVRKKLTKPNNAGSSNTYKCKASDVVTDDGSKIFNPWTSRSRNVPREPDTSHFTIDYNRDESNFDDFNSVVSLGRGRGSNISKSALNTSNSTANSSLGPLFGNRK